MSSSNNTGYTSDGKFTKPKFDDYLRRIMKISSNYFECKLNIIITIKNIHDKKIILEGQSWQKYFAKNVGTFTNLDAYFKWMGFNFTLKPEEATLSKKIQLAKNFLITRTANEVDKWTMENYFDDMVETYKFICDCDVKNHEQLYEEFQNFYIDEVIV